MEKVLLNKVVHNRTHNNEACVCKVPIYGYYFTCEGVELVLHRKIDTHKLTWGFDLLLTDKWRVSEKHSGANIGQSISNSAGGAKAKAIRVVGESMRKDPKRIHNRIFELTTKYAELGVQPTEPIFGLGDSVRIPIAKATLLSTIGGST